MQAITLPVAWRVSAQQAAGTCPRCLATSGASDLLASGRTCSLEKVRRFSWLNKYLLDICNVLDSQGDTDILLP